MHELGNEVELQRAEGEQLRHTVVDLARDAGALLGDGQFLGLQVGGGVAHGQAHLVGEQAQVRGVVHREAVRLRVHQQCNAQQLGVCQQGQRQHRARAPQERTSGGAFGLAQVGHHGGFAPRRYLPYQPFTNAVRLRHGALGQAHAGAHLQRALLVGEEHAACGRRHALHHLVQYRDQHALQVAFSPHGAVNLHEGEQVAHT